VDETAVHAELSIRRNPAATRGDGDLRLDGEQLELLEVALDGRVLPPVEYRCTRTRWWCTGCRTASCSTPGC
jgi:aminopeptidase N